jgi:WD40 repeat protein
VRRSAGAHTAGPFLLFVNSAEGHLEVHNVADRPTPVLWAVIDIQPGAEPMVEFSPDGRQVLVGTDRTVGVWDLTQSGLPVRLAAFEDLPDNVTAVDHWLPPYGFVTLTQGNIWLLRTDIDQVIRELCLDGAELPDADWAKYFPDVKRVPVC